MSTAKQHIKRAQCTHGTITHHTVAVEFPCVDSVHKKATPGPKPFDIDEYFTGRLPAFTEDAFDKRVDWLVDDDRRALDVCFAKDRGILDLLSVFSVLWGPAAPQEFRSIVFFRGRVHVLDDVDDATRVPTSISSYDSISEFMKERFFEEVFGYIDSLCAVSIPTRAPHASGKALRVRDVIMARQGCVDIKDALECTDLFRQNRWKVQRLAQTAAALRRQFRHLIMACTPKST